MHKKGDRFQERHLKPPNAVLAIRATRKNDEEKSHEEAIEKRMRDICARLLRMGTGYFESSHSQWAIHFIREETQHPLHHHG